MSKLIFCPTKYTEHLSVGFNWYPNEFIWCKAHTTEENDFVVMGAFRSCKDYMIDLHYRHQTHTVVDNWTKEQINEVCYILRLPSAHDETFEHNVVNFLNKIEKDSRFKRTTFTKFSNYKWDENEEAQTFYAIKASVMWGKNLVMRSHFLSLLRMCAFLKVGKTVTATKDFEQNQIVGNKDVDTFYNLTETARRFYIHCMYNPRILLKNPHNLEITGYTKEKQMLHGMCGLFYSLRYTATHPNVCNQNIVTLYKEWQDANAN